MSIGRFVTLFFLFLATGLASAQGNTEGRKLLSITVDDRALVRNLSNGQWATVFRRQISGQAGDLLSIRGLNQVTTEDNEVTFSARILVNGINTTQEGPQTGKQPDDVGGNHHLGLYALALYSLTSTGTVTIEFQVKGDIVSRKRGEIFVDPAPGNGISQGRLLVEHYSARGAYTLADLKRFVVGDSGQNFCCTGQDVYTSVLNGALSVAPGDIVKLAGHVTAIHNSATRNDRGFDGEQIGTALLFLNAGASGYIGENVTSRNSKLSVFNESLFEARSSGSQFGIAVGANFGRGAYLDNAATNFGALKWSQNADGLVLVSNSQSSISTRSLPSGLSTDLSREPISLPNGGIVRTSILLSVSSSQARAVQCRFDLRNNFESTTAYRTFGNGYRFSTVRLDLDSRLAPGASTSTILSASCTGDASVVKGTTTSLVYTK